MRPLSREDLTHPVADLEVAEPHIPIKRQNEPKCLGCGEHVTFTDSASEEITWGRMLVVTQTVFSCPDCGCRMVIFPKGTVPTEMQDGNLVIHPPTEGWFIALCEEDVPV